MTYHIDKTLIGDGIIQYSTDAGCKYLAKIYETAPKSNVWSIDFVKVSGNPSPLEVFKIMKTLTEASMEYAFEKNINNAVIFIAGENQEVINQKTTVFTRWIDLDWDYTIQPNIEVKIAGLRNTIMIPTNAIMMTRKQTTVQKQVVINGNVNIKFCFNCGTENKDFQFCPNCGTNLKQN
jgi:hypothetical protein